MVALGFVGAELPANPAPVSIGEFGNTGDFSMTVSDVRWPADPPENLGLHRPTFVAFDVEITNTVREPRALNLLWLRVEDTSGKRLSWRAVGRPPSLPLVGRDRVVRGDAVVPDGDALAAGETRAGTVYFEPPASGSGVVVVFGHADDPRVIVPLVGSDPGPEGHRSDPDPGLA